MAKVGPLLSSIIARLDSAGPQARGHELSMISAHVGGPKDDEQLPLVMKFKKTTPERGETWPEFKERVAKILKPRNDAITGGGAQPLFLANALAASVDVDRVRKLADLEDVDTIELDPVVNPIQMDDAVLDLRLREFRSQFGELTGKDVRVAVLDSGIDEKHPFLRVEKSVSTCGEDVAIPGSHGTHCAGSIASRDKDFPGIAPDVTLLNVKVLTSRGNGQHTGIARGVDEALDLEANILSMSLGFNHLPQWSERGHGWACTDGRCPLCTAVDNATRFGALVCVAAGNEHARAEALRRMGYGSSFDTELGCPGQAREAITVGAISKRTFQVADFSSRGPSSFGLSKPDLCGPGVNVMSTVPVPRQSNGKPIANPQRNELFDRMSGTSMATPIVAGALALIYQARREKGQSLKAAAMRKALIEAVTPMPLPKNVVGAGRIDLGVIGVSV